MSYRRSLASIVLIAALAACAAQEPPPIATPPGPSCAAALTARGGIFEAITDREGPHGCRLVDAVRMTRSSVPLDQPVQVNCGVATRLLAFEDQVLQAAAQRHFGQKLARLRHFGGYSCRNETGNSRRLSQHALANAIDISGFDLADGTQITVSRHWNDRGPRGAFLRDVAHGACRHFHVVLTPRTDAAHRTHLHLDLGPYRRCDA